MLEGDGHPRSSPSLVSFARLLRSSPLLFSPSSPTCPSLIISGAVVYDHEMLADAAGHSPIAQLLDAKFSDPVVRDYGVECLRYMAPGECADFMLQLTQVLKPEPYHHSALAKFLLQRAWSNSTIGHTFYWFLKAEMHIPMVAERYTILLETYLRGAPTHRKQLIRQAAVMNSLVRCYTGPCALCNLILTPLPRSWWPTKSRPSPRAFAWIHCARCFES